MDKRDGKRGRSCLFGWDLLVWVRRLLQSSAFCIEPSVSSPQGGEIQMNKSNKSRLNEIIKENKDKRGQDETKQSYRNFRYMKPPEYSN